MGEGHSQEEAHRVFKVGTSTIKAWKKLQAETGNLGKRELHRSFKKVDPEKLRANVSEYPDAYLKEIGAKLGCDESAVRKALRRLKITRKKNERIRRTE